MKKVCRILKETPVIIVSILMLSLMLIGCGKAAEDASVEEGENLTDSVADKIVAEELEENNEEELSIRPPFLEDLSKYDPVISKLNDNQYYAFANVGKNQDVLLVTEYVYDNLDGNMAAIDATIYSINEAGDIVETGFVTSDGTAYPLAVYDEYLMFGGNHHMSMVFVDDGNLITKKYADEIFDTDGNATYSCFDYDKKFEGNVEDDKTLKEMYDIYGKAVVINFNKTENAKNSLNEEVLSGSYIREYTDEFEGETVELKDTIVFNEDHSCEVTFQDTIAGTWDDSKIILDNGSQYDFSIDDDQLILDLDGIELIFIKE